MKYKLLALGAMTALLCSCAGTYQSERAPINEPSGSAATNAAPSTPARDMNQRPYPGVDPTFDEQKQMTPQSPY